MAEPPPINITLPWPPTVNHYWKRTVHGGIRVSAAGVRFRDEVKLAALQQLRPLRRITGAVNVSIVACQPNKRRRDLDNLLKATLDGLTHAMLYEDDSKIQRLEIRWGEMAKPDGRLEVVIEPA